MLRDHLYLKVVGACFLGEVGLVGPQGVGKKQTIHSGEDIESILLCQDSTTSCTHCGRPALAVKAVCLAGECVYHWRED